MEKNKKLKKHKAAYIFAPILGLGLIAGTVTPIALAKPNKWVDEDTTPTVELDSGSSTGVSINAKQSSLKVHEESSIKLDIEDTKKQIGNIVIKVNGKTLSEDDYVIDQKTNTIVIKATAMTGTKVNISVNTEDTIEFNFGFKGAEEAGELISHSIRRSATSTIIFSIKDGYTLEGFEGEYEVEDKKKDLKDTDFEKKSLQNNVYKITFNDKNIFEKASYLVASAVVKPVTPEEKTATIDTNFDTFKNAGININIESESFTPTISESESEIILPYTASEEVSGKITITADGTTEVKVEDVIFAKAESEDYYSIEIKSSEWSKIATQSSTWTLTFEPTTPTVKTASIIEDFETFKEAGITITEDHTKQISSSPIQESVISLPYAVREKRSGTITIESTTGLKKQVWKEFPIGGDPITIEIDTSDWEYIADEDKISITFVNDEPTVIDRAILTPDLDSFKDKYISLKEDTSETYIQKGETISWTFKNGQITTIKKFNVHFESATGESFDKEITVNNGSKTFDITLTDDEWSIIPKQDTNFTVKISSYINKEANVDVDNNFKEYFDLKSMSFNKLIENDQNTLTLGITSKKKVFGKIYLATARTPTDKLVYIDIDMEEGVSNSPVITLYNWTKINYDDTLILNFEEEESEVEINLDYCDNVFEWNEGYTHLNDDEEPEPIELKVGITYSFNFTVSSEIEGGLNCFCIVQYDKNYSVGYGKFDIVSRTSETGKLERWKYDDNDNTLRPDGSDDHISGEKVNIKIKVNSSLLYLPACVKIGK